MKVSYRSPQLPERYKIIVNREHYSMPTRTSIYIVSVLAPFYNVLPSG